MPSFLKLGVISASVVWLMAAEAASVGYSSFKVMIVGDGDDGPRVKMQNVFLSKKGKMSSLEGSDLTDNDLRAVLSYERTIDGKEVCLVLLHVAEEASFATISDALKKMERAADPKLNTIVCVYVSGLPFKNKGFPFK